MPLEVPEQMGGSRLGGACHLLKYRVDDLWHQYFEQHREVVFHSSISQQ